MQVFDRTSAVEVLAIVKDAGVQVDDHTGKIALIFTAMTSEGVGALQVIHITDERFASCWAAMQGDVRNLSGKPCWVKTERSFIYFDRMATI